MNANDEIMERYFKNREAMQQKLLAYRISMEEKLKLSIKWQENGIQKTYHGKGWTCKFCPEKKLQQSGDVGKHIEGKEHAENIMLHRLAK